MTTDIDKLRELAEKAFNAAVEVDMFQSGSLSQYEAMDKRDELLSAFQQAATPAAIETLKSHGWTPPSEGEM